MRYFLYFFLFSLFIPMGCERIAEAGKPNVIIILTDDRGWGDLSVNGNSNLSTPHIDALSTAGATLENFYVCAVCSPTRAELLTGRYHFRGGVYSTGGGGERLDLDETTLGEVFQAAGYKTANGTMACSIPTIPMEGVSKIFTGIAPATGAITFLPCWSTTGRLFREKALLLTISPSTGWTLSNRTRPGRHVPDCPGNARTKSDRFQALLV